MNDKALHARTDERTEATQRAIATLGLRGVPQLVANMDEHSHAISVEALYAGGDRLFDALASLNVSA